MEQGAGVLGLDVPCDRGAPGLVREAVARIEGVGSAADAMLVASELVTNAVLHSGGGPNDLIEVRVTVGDECLTISVRDPGISGKEAAIPPRTDIATGGFGLRLVDMTSLRWGAERGEKYCVWAELPLSGER